MMTKSSSSSAVLLCFLLRLLRVDPLRILSCHQIPRMERLERWGRLEGSHSMMCLFWAALRRSSSLESSLPELISQRPPEKVARMSACSFFGEEISRHFACSFPEMMYLSQFAFPVPFSPPRPLSLVLCRLSSDLVSVKQMPTYQRPVSRMC